ncbi:radical SAM/SPASM protein FxsB, inactivated metallohydrolase extension form [Streptomyces sp. NPDC048057]|uniref:radical SAM/SPASM protein FxsBH, inactivated beta-hydroxylase extension form n=1 Tax=Streptomyces sp. NPDC048057 TaxID=3155628 RepID=UPI0033F48C41
MTGPLVPFREIVLKVHSRCDLACDHCYIYEHADQSWRTRPKAISDEAISWTALRLAEHAKNHALPSVSVILHGGEPLLAGPARLRRVCEELTRALDGIADLDLRIHTNGLQLSPRYLDLFCEYDLKVGISLDGDRAANDRHRRFADGRTSHPLVLKAVDLLREERYRHLYLGLLCTVDVANDPVAVYDALAELEPPRIDFLLPHATWDQPPARPDGSPTAYADWLLTVFDRWDAGGRPVPVRLFESVFSTLAGGPSLTESLGLAPTDLVVVETDGALEQVDSLKSAYEGAAATGFDVMRHAFDEVAAHPGVRARQLGLASVSDACRACPVVRSCGGGLYTHRYRTSNEFDNTSVYCTDLEALIRGVERRIATELVPLAVVEPGALLADDQDVTRMLSGTLTDELAGRAGEPWADAWDLLVDLDESGDVLDEVWGHPYTRPWLARAVAAAHEERPEAVPLALELPARLAAVQVRHGHGSDVRVPYEDGVLRLPALGELTLPVERGVVTVRAVDGGFTAALPGRAPIRVRLDDPGASEGWRPVHTVGGRDGAPLLRLDDLDPYRDCHGATARGRLDEAEVAVWDRLLTEAWALLRTTAPRQAAEAAACLTTLTPLEPPADDRPDANESDVYGSVAYGSVAYGSGAGGHGYGALGIALPASPVELAGELLRGLRRSKLHALLQVCDPYVQDGQWLHPAPWRDTEVSVSQLLAETFVRVGLAALDPVGARAAGAALDTLERAPELTVSGLRLVDELRKELAAAGEEHGRG